MKALLVVRLHELRVLRHAKQSSVTRVALAGQQQSLICCFNMLINSSETTDGLQLVELATELSVPKERVTILGAFGYLKKCVLVGYHTA
jgi:hypothetical protein